jgi:hypothetical protein
MKKFSQKSVLLFGAMLVMCAFAPSAASAGTWSPVGTTHQLFSPDLSFTTTVSGNQMGWTCNGAGLDADVASASTLVVTSARFNDCMAWGFEGNCTVTPTGQNFPWTATATATTNVQIHGVNVNLAFENTPGNPTTCAFPTSVALTGTLAGGSWNSASNELFLQHDGGLTSHWSILGLGSNAVFLTGTFRDTTNTLRVSDGTECTLV